MGAGATGAILFYHGDLDGVVAAAILEYALGDVISVALPTQPFELPSVLSVTKSPRVWLVDLSLSLEAASLLLDREEVVIWDHHPDTALELLMNTRGRKPRPHRLRIKHDPRLCAAEIVYRDVGLDEPSLWTWVRLARQADGHEKATPLAKVFNTALAMATDEVRLELVRSIAELKSPEELLPLILPYASSARKTALEALARAEAGGKIVRSGDVVVVEVPAIGVSAAVVAQQLLAREGARVAFVCRLKDGRWVVTGRTRGNVVDLLRVFYRAERRAGYPTAATAEYSTTYTFEELAHHLITSVRCAPMMRAPAP